MKIYGPEQGVVKETKLKETKNKEKKTSKVPAAPQAEANK